MRLRRFDGGGAQAEVLVRHGGIASQPMRSSVPPMGVMAPSHFMAVIPMM
jgi:hypothetical protein